MDPWTHGAMDIWLHICLHNVIMDQWIHGPLTMAPYILCQCDQTMDTLTHGTMDIHHNTPFATVIIQIYGLMETWNHGHIEQWMYGTTFTWSM